MDGSVYQKKLSQRHGKSLLRNNDRISVRAAMLLEKKKCEAFFFIYFFLTLLVWICFFFSFSGVVQSCCRCFSQRHNIVNALCSGEWLSKEHLEERVSWFHFHKMNNAKKYEWNNWKLVLFLQVSPRGGKFSAAAGQTQTLDTLDSSCILPASNHREQKCLYADWVFQSFSHC